jgi:uncharacterized protein with gpF-like domain
MPKTGTHADMGQVMYTEREIPDDSEEARKIRARSSMTQKERAAESRKRMESIGLEMYIWSTAGDERVRPSHALMDNKLCRWDNPAVYSTDKGKTWKPRPKGAVLTHPEEEEGCRCTSLSYWDELVGEVDKQIVKRHKSDKSE